MGLNRVKEKLDIGCISSGQCIGKGPTNPFGGPSAPCGFCAPHEKFKFEDFTARGRFVLSQQLNANMLSPNASDLLKVAYTCTACGFCDEVCLNKPLEVFMALREELIERGVAIPEAIEKVNNNVKVKHNVFGANPESRSEWRSELSLKNKGKYLYFAGCYASYRQPETAKATIKILQTAGLDVAHLDLDEWCCGLPALWNGRRDLAKEMMEHNLEAFRSSGAETLVVSCAECYRTFKIDYPKIVGALPFKVLHVSELFAQLIREGKISLDGPGETVTYHDPCFLGRHMKVYDEPREVITSVPGVKLVEMEHSGRWSFCCGNGAGVVYAAYPDLTKWASDKRLIEAKKAANTIITACPRCVESLKKSAQNNTEIKIYDLPVFVANAMC